MPAGTGDLAVTNARLWDGTGAPPVEGATVLVRDGRVSAAGRGIVTPEGIPTLDAGGRFVMPGLVEMHAHVQLSGDEDSLRCFLGSGVTSVRDVGGSPAYLIPLRERVAAGDVPGPRLFVYGQMLDGAPPIFPPAALGPESLSWVGIDTPEEGRRAVRAQIEAGADGIKIYAGVRPDLAAVMIDAAGGEVPVTGHLGRTWASEAVAAGINCLEHVHATCYQDVARPEHRHGREDGNGAKPNYWTWLNEGWAAADLDAPYVRAFIASLVEHDVALSATMALITNGMATLEAAAEPGLAYTPRQMREAREERRKRMEAARAAGQAPPLPQVDRDVGARARDAELEFLRRVHEAGGKVLPSTDCGSHTGLVPGFSLHHDMALLVRGGIPASDVLQSATRVAAEVLRRGHDQGTLQPGRRADLLVVDGDPLTAIEDTRRVVTVVKDGVPYDPAALLEGVAT